jgi:predicted metal-binding protein
MKAYYIKYKMHDCGEVKGIQVVSNSKEGAYDKAFYEAIPENEGRCPYSAWVYSVTFRNGNCKYFNTCEGLPY